MTDETRELAALAERVEAATGADRELEVAIYSAFNPRTSNRWARAMAPSYTTSLDAATGAFPPDTMYCSGHDGTGPDPSRFFCKMITDAPACDRVRTVAGTEPLARLAVALRVRALSGTGESR